MNGLVSRYGFCFLGSGFLKVTLTTLRHLKKVPNEPGLSPNNSLEDVFISVCDHDVCHLTLLILQIKLELNVCQ